MSMGGPISKKKKKPVICQTVVSPLCFKSVILSVLLPKSKLIFACWPGFTSAHMQMPALIAGSGKSEYLLEPSSGIWDIAHVSSFPFVRVPVWEPSSRGRQQVLAPQSCVVWIHQMKKKKTTTTECVDQASSQLPPSCHLPPPKTRLNHSYLKPSQLPIQWPPGFLGTRTTSPRKLSTHLPTLTPGSIPGSH